MAPSRSKTTSEKVLEDVAVNFFGKAIVDPRHGQRRYRQCISGLGPSNRSMAEIDQTERPPRTSLDLTKEELILDRFHTYLVIGYAYPDAAQAEDFAKGSSRSAAGVESNPPQILYLGDKSPWMVVTQARQTKVSQAGYYVLTQPNQGGLCQPVPIKKSLVYFFHEYRDTSTGYEGRRRSWSEKVQADCVVSISNTESTMEETIPDDAVSDEVIAPDPVGVGQDVAMYALLQLYQKLGDTTILEAIKEHKEATSKDTHNLRPHDEILHKFMDEDTEFGETEANDLLKRLNLGSSVSVENGLRLREAAISFDDLIENYILKRWLHVCLKRLLGLHEMSYFEVKDLALLVRSEALEYLTPLEVESGLSGEEEKVSVLREGVDKVRDTVDELLVLFNRVREITVQTEPEQRTTMEVILGAYSE